MAYEVPAWSKVANQEDTGACVAFATADSVLRLYFIKVNKLNENQKFSVRYLWMAAKETDELTDRPTTFIERAGTTLKAALDVVRKYGIVLEDDLPFMANDGTQNPLVKEKLETFYIRAAQRRIAMYFNLRGETDHWKCWLSQNGPLLTRLIIDKSWDRVFTKEINRLDAYAAYDDTHEKRGHAVALVGYDNETFIIRNSRGDQWGEQGYVRVSYEYAKAAFSKEVYGIVL